MFRILLNSPGSRVRKLVARTAMLGVLLSAGVVDRASAQSFGLDDLPAAPLVGPLGPIPGLGAEDPFGLVGPPLAPSPSLGFLGALGDGAWLSPGPVVQHPGPNGFYVDAFSRHHLDLGQDLTLEFSVDRVTRGVAGTAVMAESLAGQAHGDIYTTTHTYLAPGLFAGTLGPGPFAGVLPAITGGGPGNVLTTDESAFGLLTPLGVVGPGVPVPPPTAAPALHDNLESFDNIVFDADGNGLFDVDAYFTLYPDEAVVVGLSAADIIAVAAGDAGATAVPYAPAGRMGLLPSDSIDALVMYDNNLRPIPIGSPGAPGVIEPIIDYVLFSLAPGSRSLMLFGLDAADVFYSDFTGTFAVYAPSASLGLLTTPPGNPFNGESVDALDAGAAPGFVIRDGDCEYRLTNTAGERLTAAGGLADLVAASADHIFQNWFWYRGPGDSREYALSNQIYSSASNNRARMVYLEPVADGNIPSALLIDLEYTVSDVSSNPFGVVPAPSVRCEIVIAIKVRNLTDNPMDVAFFSYNDMDLNGTSGGDSSVISGVDDHVQFITDSSTVRNRGLFKVSSTDHRAWEIGSFATIRNKLTDAVASSLANTVTPFGPGDYTGAQEWAITLGPIGSIFTAPFDEWIGSVVKEVDAKLPGPRARRNDRARPAIRKELATLPPIGPTRPTIFPGSAWREAPATRSRQR